MDWTEELVPLRKRGVYMARYRLRAPELPARFTYEIWESPHKGASYGWDARSCTGTRSSIRPYCFPSLAEAMKHGESWAKRKARELRKQQGGA